MVAAKNAFYSLFLHYNKISNFFEIFYVLLVSDRVFALLSNNILNSRHSVIEILKKLGGNMFERKGNEKVK